MTSSQKLPLAAVAAFSYLQMKRTSINIASPFKLTNRTQKQIEKKAEREKESESETGKRGKIAKVAKCVCLFKQRGN